MNIETYINNTYEKEINHLKDESQRIFNFIPQHYINKNNVYFKKVFKTIPPKIVCQKYRSAKKYKDSYLLFPTYQLAIEYHCKFQQEIFCSISNIIDDVLPKVISEEIEQLVHIKDIKI